MRGQFQHIALHHGLQVGVEPGTAAGRCGPLAGLRKATAQQAVDEPLLVAGQRSQLLWTAVDQPVHPVEVGLLAQLRAGQRPQREDLHPPGQ
jgi:hypothetical protein